MYVNPISGKGTALKIWRSVERIFDSSYFEIELLRTQYRRHAYDHVLTLDKQVYHGVICCSGDGIIHEVVNGIMARRQKEEFDIPVGVINGGSSNALAKEISSNAGEDCTAVSLAYIICKGETRKMDLCELELYNEKEKIYSFLSITIGLIADIDIDSEV